MASNILSLPFRRSQPVSLAAAMKPYILGKYGQHPDMFMADFNAIDKLRAEAINVQEAHGSGIKKLMVYAAQLQWIGGKFPVDLGVEFPWFPALGYNSGKPDVQNNLRFELASILFNLAALYSQLVFSANRATSDGLKEACSYLCNAAGVISFLRDKIIPDMRSMPPEDLDPATLECLELLLLAQAQECYWQRAVTNGLKDASIAKIAAMVSDYYSQAMDLAIKSEAISSEWIHHMTAKHHHFAAVAQFRASRDCLDKRKYGEEVARLKDAVACANEALREARYVNKTVLGDLNILKNKLLDDLQRAEKDNDIIYLQPVPPKSELKLLERRNFVAANVIPEVTDALSLLGEGRSLGRPLFAKLVPYAVHVAADIYAQRRDRLINSQVVEPLEKLDVEFQHLLQALNLPGSLQALEKPLGLPPGLLAHSEEVRERGGIARLYEYKEDVSRIKGSDQTIYFEGHAFLQQEAQEDEAARLKYGTDRWTLLPSREAAPRLYKQVDEIDGYLKSAHSSDLVVEKKLAETEDALRILSGSKAGIEAYVPNSHQAAIPPKLQAEISKLKTVLNEATRLEAKRRRVIEAVKSKAQSDDINPELLREAARIERERPMEKIEPVQFDHLFEEQLAMYEPDLARVKTEQEEHDRVVARLQEAHDAFVAARKGGASGSREREQALQRLENAYLKYKELASNLDVGRKWYNDLAKIVVKFRDECKEFFYVRRQQADQLRSDLALGISSLTVSGDDNTRERAAAGATGTARVTGPGGRGGQERFQPSWPSQSAPSYGAGAEASTATPAATSAHPPPAAAAATMPIYSASVDAAIAAATAASNAANAGASTFTSTPTPPTAGAPAPSGAATDAFLPPAPGRWTPNMGIKFTNAVPPPLASTPAGAGAGVSAGAAAATPARKTAMTAAAPPAPAASEDGFGAAAGVHPPPPPPDAAAAGRRRQAGPWDPSRGIRFG